jgi:hypothetical protein
VPGRTPRHPDGAFDAFHDSVAPGMRPEDLERTLAWKAGLVFLEEGYFWEAHEVLEPVWMATPAGSAENQLVQAVIQTANAALKARMGQAGAAARLCDLAESHLRAARSAGGDVVMALPLDHVRDRIAGLRSEA